ncbi:DNA polymerase III, subunit gamma and tau, partial [Candidatus Peribacteria bacterium RIFCSPHIGHO2_01_FULL_51_9]
MSLYRLYRPKTFGDVIGQDHIVQTLEHAVEQDKIAHAYLFSGPRGTGKTSVARILARAILTKNLQSDTTIQQLIKAIDDGNLVDLIEIDGASNRGIDDIRDLIEKTQFSPVVASAKVYIIDEVHMLTKEAFNALLKTLEEPPPYAYFILATTELHKIPATIQSRCQRFAFHHIREEDIIRHLQCIADREHIAIDRDALRSMAHHVQGGMRDAVALLDQLRSLPKITLTDVKDRIGEGGHEYIEEIFSALKLRNTAHLMEVVQKLERAGTPLEHML